MTYPKFVVSIRIKLFESKMFDELNNLCKINGKFFDNDKSDAGVQFSLKFSKIAEYLKKSIEVVEKIETFSKDYDFDENTPGNGYRGYCYTLNSAVKYLENVCKKIYKSRSSFFFQTSFYLKYHAVINHDNNYERNYFALQGN